MNKEKHAGGRPLLYETPEVLQEAIDKYFKGNRIAKLTRE